MARKKERPTKKELNRGAWTPDEDRKLSLAMDTHGANHWTTIAATTGLNRCAKSCRLRWMNYLRPNIKRGNFSDQEDDLVIRLHKLLGNRWSLIAARLPGRTDNEIKNYWNCHLSKKKIDKGEVTAGISIKELDSNIIDRNGKDNNNMHSCSSGVVDSKSSTCWNVDDFFDFSNENPSTLEWVTKFVEFRHA